MDITLPVDVTAESSRASMRARLVGIRNDSKLIVSGARRRASEGITRNLHRSEGGLGRGPVGTKVSGDGAVAVDDYRHDSRGSAEPAHAAVPLIGTSADSGMTGRVEVSSCHCQYLPTRAMRRHATHRWFITTSYSAPPTCSPRTSPH